jgi:D-hydroxyproline dehydrogenase subunit beta
MVTPVMVVGAGVVGAAVAEALSRAGHLVHLFEQGVPGSGVSGASLACIGTHMMDEAELPLIRWSCDAWAAMAARENDFEYDRCGQIRFIDTESEHRAAEYWVTLERSQGLRPSMIDPAEVRRREPLLQGDILAATWSPDDAVVNPFLAIRRLLAAARDHGAVVRTGITVSGIEVTADRVTALQTSGGMVPSEIVVLAAGPWTAPLAATCGVSLPIVPRKAQCLATTRQPPRIGSVIGACKSDGGVDAGYTQIQQAWSGQILFNTVLAGGIAEAGDPGLVPEVDRIFVRDSVATLLRLFPSLADIELLRSWVRFEAVTPDDRFVAGPAGPRGLYIAAGDGGTGFIRAPALGRLIADAIDERPSPFRTDLYDAARFGQAA